MPIHLSDSVSTLFSKASHALSNVISSAVSAFKQLVACWAGDLDASLHLSTAACLVHVIDMLVQCYSSLDNAVGAVPLITP